MKFQMVIAIILNLTFVNFIKILYVHIIGMKIELTFM